MTLHTPTIHQPTRVNAAPVLRALLALGLAIVLLASLALITTRSTPTPAGDSWQAYQAYRAGEWAPLTTSWEAYQGYRAEERASVPSQWAAYQAFRAEERLTLADEQQARFDAWLQYREEERQ